MSLLADFDPLTSPISSKPADGAPASSPSAAANAAPAAAPAKPLPKFDGSSMSYFLAAKWQSLKSNESTSQTLSFADAKPKVAEAEDLTARLLQEKAEKEKADQEKAERERQEEEKRQEEAKAAAAAGKEAIPEDAKKVELPGPDLGASGAAASRPASASPPAPLDPAIAAAQLAQDKLHESEQRARNRHADKPTLHLTRSNLSTQEQTELVGAVAIKDKTTLEITDVSKTVTKVGAQPDRTDVQGTFTLSVSADGKKVTGRIENEEVDFEVIDTSDPDKALASILGL